MKYRYYICDVFTDTRFEGNQLAVLPDAAGLSEKQMQEIAREFNFSESSFVFPAEADNTRKVRIYTPTTEVPFAGHPNIGSAFVLASIGELAEFDDTTEIVFEEQTGLVSISLRKADPGTFWCELKAPQEMSLATVISVELIASALSLPQSEIVTVTHQPRVVSVGLPFVLVELRDRSSLRRAKANLDGFQKIAEQGIAADILIYIHADDEFDIRARMFAPFDGVPEDPATGSANCALAGLLTHHNDASSGKFEWRIAQGIEMGRPSLLQARTEKKDGKLVSVWIGGTCVMVSEGLIYID
jgi:trans-2,3-dihydro-3-hydroxyanthranilate isomerase